MIGCLRVAAVAGAVLSLSASALAQIPPAMERVSPDSYVIASVRNLEQVHANVELLARQMGVPEAEREQLGAARQLLQTPGLNPEGSASIAVLQLDDGGNNFVAVLPVRDYGQFVTGLGGTGDGIDELQIEGHSFFVKNLGDGFAAASPQRELVDEFEGQPAHRGAHEAMLGVTGRSIADDSGVFVVFNIPALAPVLREGMQAGLGQVQMMAAMMGGDVPDMQQAQDIADAFFRDATSAIVGVRAIEQGATLNLGAQFRAESELAGYFDAPGNSGQLIGALPNMPFLFAFAVDASSPNLRRALEQLVAAADDPEAPQFQALNPLQALERSDGFGFLWGTTPALMGGLFLNTVAYTRTDDPQGYMNWVRDAFGTIHGQQLEGITYQTRLEEREVAGRQVHEWALRMRADPQHPGAQQAIQAQTMLFGPAGLSGYMATGERGVVMTYSRNATVLEQALTAANTPAGLADEEGIRQVAAQLPEGRTLEGYIGVGNILETALGLMGMLGMAPMDFELPERIPPVGIGGTTSEGGVRIAIHMPAEVLTTIQRLQEAFEDDDEWDWEDEEPETGLPRF